MNKQEIKNAINQEIENMRAQGDLEKRHASNVSLIVGYKVGSAISADELIDMVNARFDELEIK